MYVRSKKKKKDISGWGWESEMPSHREICRGSQRPAGDIVTSMGAVQKSCTMPRCSYYRTSMAVVQTLDFIGIDIFIFDSAWFAARAVAARLLNRVIHR